MTDCLHRPTQMIDRVYARIWRSGLWLRNRAKHASALGPIEPIMLRLAARVIPPPKSDLLVQVPNGLRMKVPAGYPVGRSYAAGAYEPELTRVFQGIVKDGMTVVDCGANLGYYTLLASSLVGPTGHTYAFEPDPKNYSYLVENVRSNSCPEVMTVLRAVSNFTGTGKFVQDPHGAEGFLTLAEDGGGAIEVSTISLDAFFEEKGWPPVQIVKMDVEGGERNALEGMRELSSRNPEMQLIMELNAPAATRAGDSVDAISSLLSHLGFVRGYVIEANHRPFLVSEKLPKTQATYNVLLVKVP
jgi:FkbM family methyltransferase